MEEILDELIAVATLGIALFGIVFSLMQRQFQKVYRSFALFLAAVALNNFPAAMLRIFEAAQIPQTHLLIAVTSIFGALCIAPTFWVYVYTLTSVAQKRPPRLFFHFVLPGLGLLAAMALPFLPADLRSGLQFEQYIASVGWPIVYIVLLGVLEIALYIQLGIYIILVIRRLLRYRRRLKDVYASTEKRELNWIFVIGLLALIFWIVQILGLLAVFGIEQTLISTVIFSWAGFAIFLTATIWGLRQRPGLLPSAPQGQQPEQESLKYEKSALTADASARIERKLRAAMKLDHLHHNANLSLWDLARHVGASPNYISQTLNEVIAENFFDFVNGYRIADAMHQLVHTDETVLAITYDVGFNARSSFYTAFKKVTGQTPSAYRKEMSGRADLDDTKGMQRDT
jgi:AraC-like DNA-binding protein